MIISFRTSMSASIAVAVRVIAALRF